MKRYESIELCTFCDILQMESLREKKTKGSALTLPFLMAYSLDQLSTYDFDRIADDTEDPEYKVNCFHFGKVFVSKPREIKRIRKVFTSLTS